MSKLATHLSDVVVASVGERKPSGIWWMACSAWRLCLLLTGPLLLIIGLKPIIYKVQNLSLLCEADALRADLWQSGTNVLAASLYYTTIALPKAGNTV